MDETRKKILDSDEFVLKEIGRLRVFYGLKHEIRYEITRNEEMDTESVADHIYGMFIISRYFLPLEDPEGVWDRQRIDDMILYHDIDEIETGDIIGWKKTDAHKSIAANAAKKVIGHVPTLLREHITSIIEEYEIQESVEARFVKALDKFEPVVHLYSESGKRISRYHNTSYDQHMSIKRPILNEFPLMQRFNEVAGAEMQRRGYFTDEAAAQS